MQQRTIFRFILMDWIAQQLHAPSPQQRIAVGAFFRGSGHDKAAAAGKDSLCKLAAAAFFQLWVGNEAYARLRSAA